MEPKFRYFRAKILFWEYVDDEFFTFWYSKLWRCSHTFYDVYAQKSPFYQNIDICFVFFVCSLLEEKTNFVESLFHVLATQFCFWRLLSWGWHIVSSLFIHSNRKSWKIQWQKNHSFLILVWKTNMTKKICILKFQILCIHILCHVYVGMVWYVKSPHISGIYTYRWYTYWYVYHKSSVIRPNSSEIRI